METETKDRHKYEPIGHYYDQLGRRRHSGALVAQEEGKIVDHEYFIIIAYVALYDKASDTRCIYLTV